MSDDDEFDCADGGLWCIICGERTPGAPPPIEEMKGRRRDRIRRLIDLAENWRCHRCLDDVGDDV